MQLDQENYGTTKEKLYRGERGVEGHKTRPSKFWGERLGV